MKISWKKTGFTGERKYFSDRITKKQKRQRKPKEKKYCSKCRLVKFFISAHGRTKYKTSSQKKFFFLWIVFKSKKKPVHNLKKDQTRIDKKKAEKSIQKMKHWVCWFIYLSISQRLHQANSTYCQPTFVSRYLFVSFDLHQRDDHSSFKICLFFPILIRPEQLNMYNNKKNRSGKKKGHTYLVYVKLKTKKTFRESTPVHFWVLVHEKKNKGTWVDLKSTPHPPRKNKVPSNAFSPGSGF